MQVDRDALLRLLCGCSIVGLAIDCQVGGLGFAGGELELCVLTRSFWDNIHRDEWCEQDTERISNKEKN